MKKTLIIVILNFTWGILMNIIGFIIAIPFIIKSLFSKTYKIKKSCFAYSIPIPYNNGSFSCGIFLFMCRDYDFYDTTHELGHSIQNAYWGILFPFVIGIPSIIRYWYREYIYHKGMFPRTHYESIWFENDATRKGIKYAFQMFKNIGC